MSIWVGSAHRPRRRYGNRLGSRYAMNIAKIYLPNWLYYVDVAANTDISALDDKGLITLVKPNNEQTLLRVKNRLEELQRENAKGMATIAAISFALIDSCSRRSDGARLRGEASGWVFGEDWFSNEESRYTRERNWPISSWRHRTSSC